MWNKDRLRGLPMPESDNWYNEPVTMFEAAKKSYTYHKAAMTPGAADAFTDEVDKRNFKIQNLISAGIIDPKNWLLPEDRWTSNTSAAMKGFGSVDFSSLAKYLKQQGMEIQDDDDITGALRESVLAAKTEAERPGGAVGKFAGVLGAELTDPYNIAYGMAAAATGNALSPHNLARVGKLLRTGQLAAEGALTESATVPQRKKGAEFYGHEYGIKEAAMDITAGALGMPALDALFRAGAKGVKALTSRQAAEGLRKNFPGSPSANKLADHLEMGEDTPIEEFILSQREAEQRINEPVQKPVEEMEAIPEEITTEMHRQTETEYQQAIERQPMAENPAVKELEVKQEAIAILRACAGL